MDDLVVGVGKPQGLKKLLLQVGLEMDPVMLRVEKLLPQCFSTNRGVPTPPTI